MAVLTLTMPLNDAHLALVVKELLYSGFTLNRESLRAIRKGSHLQMVALWWVGVQKWNKGYDTD